MKQLNVVLPDGSMQDIVTGLMVRAGLRPIMEKKRTKQAKVEVSWINQVAFQRPQEIPKLLNSGSFDVAVAGQDWIKNWGFIFEELLVLPIGRSGIRKPVKIVLAVKKESGFKNLQALPLNCEIATEYVHLAQSFLSDSGRPDICVVPSYGNTENKIEFGAVGIVDITESGNSLRENGLEIIYEIMESNTVVVANAAALADPDRRLLIDRFVRLIKGAFQASNYVMITANVPKSSLESAVKIMGGLKGATISGLTTKGWFVLQSAVLKEKEHKIIFELLEIGVTDIIINREISLVMS